MTSLFIPLKIFVWYNKTNILGLRNCSVDKPLTQFIVTVFFTFQRINSALFGELLSDGPNIINDGHQKRFIASCAISFVPVNHSSMLQEFHNLAYDENFLPYKFSPSLVHKDRKNLLPMLSDLQLQLRQQASQ